MFLPFCPASGKLFTQARVQFLAITLYPLILGPLLPPFRLPKCDIFIALPFVFEFALSSSSYKFKRPHVW
ncbi:hypothetical protein PISMIDRAFT_681533 [Pisolithus microcarpus 441]|uniref:Uncharacterized protein n=1 Tax=Pisolithus microcarpus 441 TaxID=765257 RepID=A0A0C9Y9B1_9AGAM|nr:hypothetical protein PISMIDRAFT_681533 [Pisolithus microcarpus 441]